jgi:CheY-like chemotaxis protein/HPt (histidine-containing phosphotransfer) domain-containing protein
MNETILRESKDDTVLEYSSNIKSAGNTLLSIINNILDFSKIEDGKMSLVPVEFDVAEQINNLVNSISERARAKDLEFIVDVDESVPSRLFGDDVRISQVIMNLLTNAVKYTEQGSVTLRVRNKGINDGNALLRFDVIDTGIGIKEEDLDKLFQTFERIEEKRNRHIEGTGLGISIVVKLLSMMNSKLDVDSKYAIGSTFGFDLSLRVVDPSPVGKLEEKKKISPVGKDEAEHLYAPAARILVTDDNAMNLKVACNYLKLFGITPVTCSSGRETIELLRKERFDILLLDHMMPQMDGIETLEVLKQENILNGAAVIALTANAVVGAEEQYLKAGFDGYLSKPIMVDDIENALKKYLPERVIENKVEDDSSSEVLEFDAVPGPDVSSVAGDNTGTSLTLAKARSVGLNVDAGLGYACGEEDFYLELLTDYLNCTSDKCVELTSYLENSDLKNYEVLVHSIKSASKTIGADSLSEQAKELEAASKNNDMDFVKAHHGALVKDFKELAGKLADQ